MAEGGQPLRGHYLTEVLGAHDGAVVAHDRGDSVALSFARRCSKGLEALAAMPVKTTLVWGLYEEVSPLRFAAHVWDTYLATKPGANEFWLLPRANHYLQNDQPREFVQVLEATLSNSSPLAPGALSAELGAPVFLDRSRSRLLSAKEILLRQVNSNQVTRVTRPA